MAITFSNGTMTNGTIGVFNPISLNPSYWHDPKVESNVVKNVSDEMSEQLDSSGNGESATQGTDIQKPIWTPNGIGTNSAAFYDGSNDKMVMTTFNWPLQWHLFIVIKPTNVSGQHRIMSSYDGSGGFQFTGEYFLQVINGFLQFQAANLSPPLITSSAIISANTPYLVELYSDASKNLEMFVNNISVATGTHGTTGATKPINIGFDDPASGSFHFTGYVGDNLMTPAKLSTPNRDFMRNYIDSNYPTIGL